MKEALVLMAKAPIEGQVKTRLIGALTAEQAKLLYIAFLSDTFAMMESVCDERDDLRLVMCYTPEGEEETFDDVEREGCLMIAQRGNDLGERLTNCFADVFEMGFDSVIAIGGDSPTLPDEMVLEAFDCLENENDVVVVPAEDKGYCLIGMRKLHPQIFQNIPWSTADVMSATEAQAKNASVSLIVGPDWYDVDTPEELERLKQELKETKGTAKFTRRILKEFAQNASAIPRA
ncbi:MAG TPA: TIGR04282 family arsenosugar biosynthesis glycosyltransferase [Blastocatellia bacterium]|nr:TIGR04282 family arsenosugar biosynthesis glycosyltransferase [Blastocatellia bacterium]